MPGYFYTPYFEGRVCRDRPYIRPEWCIQVIESPLRSLQQADGRWRFWGAISELGGRYLRVVTLEDRVTIRNAFLDRRFRP